MAQRSTFYGIWTADSESTGSIKAYCRTKKIAIRELKKYRDFGSSKPPKPDAIHIHKLNMIVI